MEENARQTKSRELAEAGVSLYPHRWDGWENRVSAAVANSYGTSLKEEEKTDKRVQVAGRVMQTRVMGKAAFFHILDDGVKLQLYLKRDVMDELDKEGSYNLFKKRVHTGDFIGVTGTIFKTKTGEITVEVHKLTLLSKALRELPEKWHGLKDTDTRYRKRHLDLIANPEVRKVFVTRSKLLSSIRKTCESLGFLEVETPILLHQAGGATARPFETKHNALGTNLVMRIATELPLKKLIIGGYPAVYEIGRIFRNEGIDTTHNPEFTTVEAYQAYTDYNGMAAFFEKIMSDATEAVGVDKVEYKGQEISLKPPYKRAFMPELWKEHCGADIHDVLKGKGFNRDGLLALAKKLGLEGVDGIPDAKIFDRIFEMKIEPLLIVPTFVFDHPTAITPLAKCKENADGTIDESLCERFELFVAGMELANAYTELNDPVDQRERFAEQSSQKDEGHDEAELLDEEFVEAMEQGMPPTGGIGFGIDRLVMLLTGNPSIREVILFPTLKPE